MQRAGRCLGIQPTKISSFLRTFVGPLYFSCSVKILSSDRFEPIFDLSVWPHFNLSRAEKVIIFFIFESRGCAIKSGLQYVSRTLLQRFLINGTQLKKRIFKAKRYGWTSFDWCVWAGIIHHECYKSNKVFNMITRR